MQISARLLLFVIAWSAVGGETALACGICFTIAGDVLSLPHPKAIEIAVATRTALDKGFIRAPEVSRTGWNRRENRHGLFLMNRWSEKLRGMPIQQANDAFTFHVVLIDTSEAFVVHVRGNALVCVPGKMERNQTGLVTTSIALAALLDGRMAWAQAARMQLLLVEGNESYLSRFGSYPFAVLDK